MYRRRTFVTLAVRSISLLHIRLGSAALNASCYVLARIGGCKGEYNINILQTIGSMIAQT
jgi:hypothetical protein